MNNILQKIAAYKRQEIMAAKAAHPLAEIERVARDMPAPHGFLARLTARAAQGQTALIGEIKKASPSQGLIRTDFDPSTLAHAYAEGGATCLSVLTDSPSFQGAPAHLQQARSAVSLPILRKDFLFDPYQIVEARAWQADCVLIIMACLSDDEARDLLATARDWQMDALIEVHDRDELDRALRLTPTMIGINNRDLKTFTVHLQTSLDLAAYVPDEIHLVSESGIATQADIARLAEIGITSLLIGESLMRQPDVAVATKALLEG